jgi:arginyl-tRNA synthetase
MNARNLLQSAVDTALSSFDNLDSVSSDVLQVVPATNPQFGDYQFNGSLPLAKVLRQKPRDIATQILEKLDVSEISETPEIAGAGFINFRLKTDFLNGQINAAKADSRLGVASPTDIRKFVVDFSSPNTAKPMHVGHIRSTIIGDAISRILKFAGHEVIRDNHIGDWGTAFGKIIVGWKSQLDETNLQNDPIGEMERLYKSVNDAAKQDPTVEDSARAETAKLQAGDAENLAIWEKVRDLSQAQFDEIYAILGIEFDYTLGESFYNPRLPALVNELLEKGVARESEGAVAIFSERKTEPKNDPFLISRDGEWKDFPAIVRKSDGASTYATTDLATLEYRLNEWAPNEIVYVTDSRQSGHFKQVFEAFKRWKGDSSAQLVHAGFGMILGEDKTPFKTRSGDTVKLRELLDEAIERSEKIIAEKNPEFDAATVSQIARVVGISAVKYADLSQNRATDYVFSWDKMLSMNGNSAVYLLYAYVRTQSVLRRIGESTDGQISLVEPTEIDLAKQILRFGEAIENSLEDFRPHIMCDYLYELSGKLSAFWRDCNIKDAPDEIRASRLALVKLTGDVLKTGFGLLGIETVEQM